ncbi:MAG: response regulator [Rhodocyclaceae bacterium]|nr:response regulator [Rhodocyclaceae bacterium]MBX3667551.1 response regulator [Rhodocyclaceae bacterium]
MADLRSIPSILVVDDSPEDAEFIVSAIRSIASGEQIAVAVNGDQALDLLEPEPGSSLRAMPRLMLLDLKQRDDALSLLRRVRANSSTKLVPVVVLSAVVGQSEVRRAAQFGANSFVRKPADPLRLGDTVRSLATYWIDLNLPPPDNFHA